MTRNVGILQAGACGTTMWHYGIATIDCTGSAVKKIELEFVNHNTNDMHKLHLIVRLLVEIDKPW
jgi:hypothetical protein